MLGFGSLGKFDLRHNGRKLGFNPQFDLFAPFEKRIKEIKRRNVSGNR